DAGQRVLSQLPAVPVRAGIDAAFCRGPLPADDLQYPHDPGGRRLSDLSLSARREHLGAEPQRDLELGCALGPLSSARPRWVRRAVLAALPHAPVGAAGPGAAEGGRCDGLAV